MNGTKKNMLNLRQKIEVLEKLGYICQKVEKDGKTFAIYAGRHSDESAAKAISQDLDYDITTTNVAHIRSEMIGPVRVERVVGKRGLKARVADVEDRIADLQRQVLGLCDMIADLQRQVFGQRDMIADLRADFTAHTTSWPAHQTPSKIGLGTGFTVNPET